MKLRIAKDIYTRAQDCAYRVDMPVGRWCGLACKRYGTTGKFAVGHRVANKGASVVATIDGEWDTKAAQYAIEYACDCVEKLNARLPPLFGDDEARCAAMLGDRITAVESATKSAARSTLRFGEAAV